MAAAKPIGIWIRVSTDRQVQGESPEHHERRCRAYAEAKGWEVKALYRLEAVSGKSVRNHPECERMVRDVAVGNIEALVFSNLSRLARNTRELLTFADLFEAHDADLVSLTDEIDTTTPAGRMFFTVKAALAQFEREEISKRVAASVPVRARMGKPLGGVPPFGYRWVDKNLVVDPDEAPIRKLIHELFIELGGRNRTVAAELNRRGYRTRRGKRWTDSSVRALIRDPTPTGRRRANWTSRKGNRVVEKPQSEWIWTKVEPIITEELWQACQALGVPRRRGPRVGKRVRYTFAGLTFCDCGGAMRVPSNSPKYTCKVCRRKIPIDDLEAIFHEQLRDFFFSPERIAAELARLDQGLAEREALRAPLAAEVARLTTRMDRVMQLYLEEQISSAGFGERYAPLEARRDEVRAELADLEGKLDHLRIGSATGADLIARAGDLYGSWQQFDQKDRRRIVEQIVDRITIGEGTVTIDLSFLASNEARPQTAALGQETVTPSSPSRSSAASARGSSSRRRTMGPGFPPRSSTRSRSPPRYSIW